MKSAYELAMERLSKSEPHAILTDSQKIEIAEIDSKFRAKMAERELFLKPKIQEARFGRDHATANELERQLVADKKNLENEMEAAKEAVRSRTS